MRPPRKILDLIRKEHPGCVIRNDWEHNPESGRFVGYMQLDNKEYTLSIATTTGCHHVEFLAPTLPGMEIYS